MQAAPAMCTTLGGVRLLDGDNTGAMQILPVTFAVRRFLRSEPVDCMLPKQSMASVNISRAQESSNLEELCRMSDICQPSML